MNADAYREYLEKEITIMGTLSAFCALAVAAVLTATPSGTLLGTTPGGLGQRVLVLLGSLCTLLAALVFYLQRSKFARYYGWIALAQSKGEEVQSLLDKANERSMGIRYHVAFALLTAGFFDYALATLWTPKGWLESQVAKVTSESSITDGLPQGLIAAIALCAAAVYGVAATYVLTKYSRKDHPWREALTRIIHRPLR